MDVLTHGLLGAALAQSAAPRSEARLAAGVGLAAGMLADADTLISSAEDSLLVLEYHRHFTHALVFVPLGALIAAALLWPFLRRRLSFPRLSLRCWATRSRASWTPARATAPTCSGRSRTNASRGASSPSSTR